MTFISDISRSGSHSGFGVIEAVTHPLRALVRSVKRYSDYASAEVQLNALSDHTLADIGLARSEIHSRVWESFERA